MVNPCALLLGFLISVVQQPGSQTSRPTDQVVLQIEQTVQNVIRETEPSVACILISRSDAYRKLFKDEPPPDNPGKLGSFKPMLNRRNPLLLPGSDRTDRSDDSTRRYDLSAHDAVPESSGTGVVLDGKELLVLTNYHVVRDATKIYVRLPNGHGSYADIHAADPRSDLAVLKLLETGSQPLTSIKLGTADSFQKGQWVVCLAHPFTPGYRDNGPSASWGIISNVRRRAIGLATEEDGRAFYLHGTLLQTDARLNQGTSGGVLVNWKGELIGLTTSRAAIVGSETSAGLAVPIDANFRRIIDRLRQGVEVEYGFLGVKCQVNSARSEGLWVEGVVRGSPAEKAGLRLGDTIVSVNGKRVQDPDDLYLQVAFLPAGSEARIEARNRSQPLVASLAKHFVPGKIIASRKPLPVLGMRVDFTSVPYLQGEGGGPFRQREIHPGVYVCEVQSSSRAAAAKLQVGDIVTHVNGQKVGSPAEFYKEAAKAPTSAPLELTLYSGDWGHSYRSTTITIP